MAGLKDLPLQALYDRPKITPAVLDQIILKEDFSTIQENYCNKVCTLKGACYKSAPPVVFNLGKPLDIAFVQNHKAVSEIRKGAVTREAWKFEKTHEEILKTALSKAGGSNVSYRMFNSIRCNMDEQSTTGKKISQKQLNACVPYALQELKRASPKIIVSLNTETTKALGLSKLSNTNNIGEIHISPVLGIPVLLALHPKMYTMIRQNASGKMWGPDYFSIFVDGLKNALQVASGKIKVKDIQDAVEDARKRIFIPRSLQEVEASIAAINSLPGDHPVVAWDLETTGLDPWDEDARILLSQFGYTDPATDRIVSVAIPMWHRENKFFNPDEAWKLIAPVLTSEKILKTGHNVKFDIQYAAVTTGTRLRGLFCDTMLVLHDLNSGLQGAYGLKLAVWLHLYESGLGGYEDLLGVSEEEGEEDDNEAEN